MQVIQPPRDRLCPPEPLLPSAIVLGNPPLNRLKSLRSIAESSDKRCKAPDESRNDMKRIKAASTHPRYPLISSSNDDDDDNNDRDEDDDDEVRSAQHSHRHPTQQCPALPVQLTKPGNPAKIRHRTSLPRAERTHARKKRTQPQTPNPEP